MNKKKRISAKEKGTLVLRILRGSLIEEVSREAGVSVAVLSQWREQFIESGNNGFKRNPQESLEHRYEQIVGRQHMENITHREIHSSSIRPKRKSRNYCGGLFSLHSYSKAIRHKIQQQYRMGK